jgi:DNA repair photolyase
MPPSHIIYTNVVNLGKEISAEPYVHRAALTLWTIISYALKATLLRIPANFHEAANYIRYEFVKEGIGSKDEAVDLLHDLLSRRDSEIFDILVTNKKKGANQILGYTEKHLRVSRKALLNYYSKNARYLPRISAAEYTDLIALDHLCGHTNVLMKQVAQVPDIEVTLRTKSAYVDEILAHDGDNRVTIAVNFNPQSVIDRYEEGTASLRERIIAAQKVQAAKGFRLALVIEPVIKYPGYENEYVSLVKLLGKSLDLRRVADIAVGCVRYSGKLEARVKRNFPNTDLFDPSQGLSIAQANDRRRYSLSERLKIYEMIFDEFRIHTKAYQRLGAENPTVWEGLGFDPGTLMAKSVHQYGN